jgi:broad specificity phosphatase PhoE
MKVTLVRHAEVEEPYIGCYNGHIDIGLSKKGYEDAKKLNKHFKESDFDAIFCSDLKRTKETLKQFIKSDKVIYTKKIREKSWGAYEGMSFDEITSTTNLNYVNFTQWTKALGGEEIEEFISRVKKFFFEYLPTIKKENILVVTHSGVIKTYLHLIKGISLEEAFSVSVPYSSFIYYDKISNKIMKKDK